MHIILPFAQLKDQSFSNSLASLPLTKLAYWLNGLGNVMLSDEFQLTLPQEIILSQLYGLPCQDGLVPWAAYQAQQLSLYQPDSHWAQLNLCHWQVDSQQIRLLPISALAISAQEDQQLLALLKEFFKDDAISLYPGQQPGQWLAQSQLFTQLPSVSSQRLMLRQPEPLLLGTSDSKSAKTIMRLQQETQMLLYRHQINEQRLAKKLLPINGFVLTNTGSLPKQQIIKPLVVQYLTETEQQINANANAVVINWLVEPAVCNNNAWWLHNWQAIETKLLPQLAQLANNKNNFSFAICGENRYHSYTIKPLAWQQRISKLWSQSKPTISELLKPLL